MNYKNLRFWGVKEGVLREMTQKTFKKTMQEKFSNFRTRGEKKRFLFEVNVSSFYLDVLCFLHTNRWIRENVCIQNINTKINIQGQQNHQSHQFSSLYQYYEPMVILVK